MSDDDPNVRRSDDSGAPPLAVVACEGADVLALFDLGSGEPVGEIPVGSHPVHLTTCEGGVAVATMGERAVTLVDRGGEVHRIETGVLGPSHFAEADGRLFVPCTAGDALAVVDPVARELDGRIGVGAEPHEIAVADGLVYVGSRADGEVTVVDAVERERVGRVTAGDGARIQGLHVDADVGVGYAVDQSNAEVMAFELCGGERNPFATAPVGRDPYDLTVSEDAVFVPSRADGTIHRLDRDLGELDVRTGFETPVDVVGADGEEWVIDRAEAALSTVTGRRIDAPAPSIAATGVDGTLVGGSIGRDVATDDHTVDATTDDDDLDVADGGTAADAADGNDYLLCSHYDDGAVSLIDPENGILRRMVAPAHPFDAIVL